MSSGQVSQDQPWKARTLGEEAQHARAKEQEQLKAIRENLQHGGSNQAQPAATQPAADVSKAHDFEGGFGGQEDLEDRYATTYGMH